MVSALNPFELGGFVSLSFSLYAHLATPPPPFGTQPALLNVLRGRPHSALSAHRRMAALLPSYQLNFSEPGGSWWYHQAISMHLLAFNPLSMAGTVAEMVRMFAVGEAQLAMKDAVLAGCKEVGCMCDQSRLLLHLQHVWQRLTDHFGSEIVPRFRRVALQVCGDKMCLAGPRLG